MCKMNKKNTRVRFTYEDDLALLREFLNVNPIVNSQGWETVQQHLNIITGKSFLIRTLKKHLMLLLEMFLRKVKVDKIRSGIEEPQNERNVLLQEVSDICQEYNFDFKENRKRTPTKDQQIAQLGKKIRDDHAIGSFQKKSEYCTGVSDSSVLKDHDYDMSSDFPENAEDWNNFDNNNSGNEIIRIYSDIPSSTLAQANTESLLTQTSTASTLAQPNIAHMLVQDSTAPSLPQESTASNQTSMASTSKETVQANETQISQSKIASTKNKILVPSRRRVNKREPLRKNALAYLTEKNERDDCIKRKELELEQRRIALEERKVAIEEKKVQVEETRIQLDDKKLELEHKERMERLEIEKSNHKIDLEQKKITNQLLLSQQQLIDNLLKK